MASTLPATAAQPVDAAAPRNRRPRRRLSSIGRPNPWVYAFLAVVLLGSIFPLYWSLLIGSGDSSTLNDPNKSWSKWTPSGTLELTITNPEAFNQFAVGQDYFVDFTPVPSAGARTP